MHALSHLIYQPLNMSASADREQRVCNLEEEGKEEEEEEGEEEEDHCGSMEEERGRRGVCVAKNELSS